MPGLRAQVAAPTLEESARARAEEIGRAGRRDREPEAYGAALRTSDAARERIRAFVECKRRAR